MITVRVSVHSAVLQVPESGIYSAGYFSECDHYTNGRQNSGSVQGKHSVICGSSGNYGCILSTGMLEELSRRLIEGGYTADTPAAIVYKATWPEQKTFVCTVGTLAKTAAEK